MGAGADMAEASWQLALDVARSQGARSWELRAASSLAARWLEQGQHERAATLLRAACSHLEPDSTDADADDARRKLATAQAV